jgi:hypothetical protein
VSISTVDSAAKMNGCLTGAAGPTLDDWASITNKVRPWTTVDHGFENGGSWGGDYVTQTFAPRYGTKYLSIAPNKSIWQTVRVRNGGGTVRIGGWFKHNGSGSVKWKARYRSYTPGAFSLPSEGLCDAGTTGAWTTQTVGSSTDPDGASTWNLFDYSPSIYIGSNVDLQVQVYNAATEIVFLDNVSYIGI